MSSETRPVERFAVQDEHSGERQSLTVLLKLEVHPIGRTGTVARGAGKTYLMDDGTTAARIDNDRYRVGMRTFKRVPTE